MPAKYRETRVGEYKDTKKRFGRTEFYQLLSDGNFADFCRFIVFKPKGMTARTFSPELWYPSQIQFELERTGKDVVLKPRQIGMTTMEEIRDLFFALRYPGSVVAVYNYSEKQANSNISNIRQIYDRLASTLHRIGMEDEFPLLGDNHDRRIKTQQSWLRFANGSEIHAFGAGVNERVAGNAGRGKAFDRLHLSELSRYALPEETMDAALEALGDNHEGREIPAEIVIESTPKRIGDYFYNVVKGAERGENGYKLHFFKWWDNPKYRSINHPNLKSLEPQTDHEKRMLSMDIPPSNVLWWRSHLRDKKHNDVEKMLREYPLDTDSCFSSNGSAVLDGSTLASLKELIATPKDIIELQAGVSSFNLKVYEEPQPGDSYILAADIAEGGGNDNSVALVLNAKTMQIAAIGASNRIPEEDFGRILITVGKMYFDALIVPETNFGTPAISVLVREGYPNIYHRIQRRGDREEQIAGFKMMTANRRHMQSIFLSVLKDGESVQWLDQEMYEEILNLEVQSNGKIAARNKNHDGKDDRVIAYMIALYAWNEQSQVSDSGFEFVSVRSRTFGRRFLM